MIAASSGARVERLLPQNVEAERSILGAVLLQQECMISIVDRLSPDDFSRSAHRDIWGTMLAMYVDGVWIDQVTLVDALAHRGPLAQVGGGARAYVVVGRGAERSLRAEGARGHRQRRARDHGARGERRAQGRSAAALRPRDGSSRRPRRALQAKAGDLRAGDRTSRA